MSQCVDCGRNTHCTYDICDNCHTQIHKLQAKVQELEAKRKKLQRLVDRCMKDCYVRDSMEHDLFRDMKEETTEWKAQKEQG